MQQTELRIMCAIVEGNHYDFHGKKFIDNESMSCNAKNVLYARAMAVTNII